MRKNAIEVIQGRTENDSLVFFLYTLDENDDYKNESVWVKANPNLSVSCSLDYIRD
jgi:phage terminase large subunit-like protein